MITLLLFLLVLTILVLVHECGHFFVARAIGADVEEFGFGFPPRVWGIKRGKTLYSINAIPLGGFVKIRGEQGGDEKAAGSFSSKPVWQRLLVLAAGVGMNVVLAWILFTILAAVGVPQGIDGAMPSHARVGERSVMVMEVLPDGPAQTAGISMGESIVAVNGEPVTAVATLQERLRSAGETPLSLEVRRGTETRVVTVRTAVLPQTGQPGIGVSLMETGIVSYPWYVAPLRGLEMTWLATTAILQAFVALISQMVGGRSVGADVSGPIGIAVATGQVARLGIVYLLQFTALLSLNLAVVNILPIPALDGGRVLFVLIEKVRRKPLAGHIEGWFHQIGFFLLMALVLVVTVADIRRFGAGMIEAAFGWIR